MDELTKIALVGTSKYAGPLPEPDHPAVALVTGLADDDRERSLLLRWGTRSVCELAGRRAVAGIEPIVPAPSETKKTASRTLAGLLQTIVAAGGQELLIDCLRQMHEQAVVLPPAVLPLVLDSKDAEVCRCLIPVLGERGTWLCRQNPDWSFFHDHAAQPTRVDVEALEQTWNEGTIDQRCQALEVLRRDDPLTARDWIAQVYAKEKSKHRVKLVESLETGLCDDDEVFLESCLNDRSSAVGQVAARLLCLLPRSALAGRMRGRAAAILAVETKGISLEKTKLVCTPPQEIDGDWERDGIPKRAPLGVGERAFWTERVLAAVPPSFWVSQFGPEPAALITAVTDDPFAAPVVAGWAEAVIMFASSDPASAEWLAPLWRHCVVAVRILKAANRVSALGRMRALLPLMTPELAEEAVVSHMEPAPGWEDALALNFLPALSRPWSARFSAALLATARRRVQSRANESAYRWANVLAAHACSIPAAAFPLALAPWEIAAPEEPTTWFAANIQREIDKFIATIETRQNFMTELNA